MGDGAIAAATDASSKQGEVQALGYELLANAQLDKDPAAAAASGKKLQSMGSSQRNRSWEAKGMSLVASAHLKSYEVDSKYLDGGIEELLSMAKGSLAIFE